MDAELKAYLEQRFNSLEARLSSGTGVNLPNSGVGLVGPGLTRVRGAAIDLKEPIAADWRPTNNAIVFGSQYRTFVDEPSNGHRGGLPMRSPSGYPLNYAVNGDGTLRVPPTLIWGERSDLKDEAELQDYKNAVLDREANPRGGSFSPTPPGG